MNNYPSSNFSTIFFLVAIFIGMGLLIYHTFELTKANGEIRAAVEAAQADVAALNEENEAIKNENSALKTQNQSLLAENGQLKTALEQTVAANAALRAAQGGTPPDLETLRSENQALKLENLQLKAQQGSAASDRAISEVLQSGVLPASAEFWTMAAVAGLAAAGLLFSGFIVALLKDMRRKQAAVNRLYSGNGPARTSGPRPTVIDSRSFHR